MNYICTGCGNSANEINLARPSIDDRYPIGHCIVCTPWPPRKRNPLQPDKDADNAYTQPPRKSIALIRSDLFNREAFDHRKKVEQMRTLAAKLTSKAAVKMSDVELDAAREAVVWLRRET